MLEVLRGLSPLLTVAYLSPLTISGSLAAILTGLFIHKLGPAWVMVIAMCAFLIGTVLLATLPVFQVYWAQIFVCVLITPFGMDMSFPSATLVISNAAKKEHQGVAASLVNTIVCSHAGSSSLASSAHPFCYISLTSHCCRSTTVFPSG
jgi:MFS family permease